MLTPERWQHLKVLYEAASQMPRSEWESFIHSACRGDEELGQWLRKILEQSSQSSGMLDNPVGFLVPKTAAPHVPAFSPGQVLHSRFEVIAFLGKGGMGEVYQAFDRELQEQIALKTVRGDSRRPEAMLRRLRQEVSRSRRIAHPSVCRVYEFFTPAPNSGPAISFLTMQLLAGPTLAEYLQDHGPLSAAEAAPIVEQVLLALAAAHEAGIVHRDLKPGNIILVGFGTAECRAVVTDFGLAVERHVLPESTSESAPLFAGTPLYMAPEQFTGQATIASDIYSFGILLTELFTGSARPSPDSIHDLPAPWRVVILRCVESQPQGRFQSARDVLAALAPIATLRPPVRNTRRQYLLGSGAAIAALGGACAVIKNYEAKPGRKSTVIVVPFRNKGKGPDDTLLADGVTDGLIDGLGRRKLLHVIAHASAFHYRDRNVDARALKRELKVTHVLSGTVETTGTEARVTASLFAAPGGEKIWSKEYVSPLRSILAMQTEIARDVTNALQAITRSERFPDDHVLSTADLEAYKLYLKGRYQWNLRSESGFRQAIDCFREAIGLDPSSDRAYCGLADAYCLLGFYGFAQPNDVMPPATVAAQRALTLNDSLAGAYTSLGLIQAVYDWNWTAARDNLKKAIELDPGYVTGRQWHAYYMAWTGQAREAEAEMLLAQTLDPLSIGLIHSLAWLAFWNREYRKAESHLRHAIALNPRFMAVYGPLAQSCAQQSRFQEALTIIKEEENLGAGSSILPELARIQAMAGDREAAMRSVAEAERAMKGRSSSGIIMAMAYEALQNREMAFNWLHAALEERACQLVFLKVDPRLDGLRRDPRFQTLLRSVHLA